MKKTTLSELIYSDLSRITKPSLKSFIKSYFFTRGGVFRFTVWLRIVSYIKTKKSLILFYPAAYLIFRHYTYKYGVHIDSNITIGKGLMIVHGDGVYINCNEIGDNFTIYQNVTVGVDAGGKPSIGDNVTIYPGAVVVGKIMLNNNCIVGANSFLNKTVSEGITVAGVPAKRIK